MKRPLNKTAAFLRMEYPQSEFLRDFAEWNATLSHMPLRARARLLFSTRYGRQGWVFSFRFKRFICILEALHGKLPTFVRERLVFDEAEKHGFVSHAFLLALHQWYCLPAMKSADALPIPDWEAVLAIHDRNIVAFQKICALMPP
jgi:hypothetical protein